MTGISVSCPKCSASLKLPDRSMHGRKAKCPKCRNSFILRIPGEGEQPARAQSDKTPEKVGSKPMTGTSARWIPDAPAAEASPEIPVFPLADGDPATRVSPSSADSTPPQQPDAAPPLAVQPAVAAFDFSAPQDSAEAEAKKPGSAIERVRRRRKKSVMPMVLTGISTAVLAGTVLAAVLINRQQNQAAEKRQPAAVNAEWEREKAAIASSNEQAIALSPTSGEPIPLNYIPFTPHLLLHLRPSDIWQRDRNFAEFQATLGDLGLWLKSNIQTMARFEPEEIEEVTFAINFGPRNSRPDIAAVVRLKEKQTEGELFRRFDGQVRPDLDVNVYESGDLSFLLVDLQTFTVASTSLVDALVAAKDYPALAPADLEPLLKGSDRNRHATLMFDVTNIDIHRESVFREELWPMTDQMVVWFGKEIDSVSWSIHLQPNLFVETLLRQSNESSALKVQRHFRLQLDKLPERLLKLAQLMRPTSEGSRQMVGRFPAMMQAVSQATSVDVSGQYVRCVTVLPQKAAANIAAGSLLTWNQSVVTDFTTAVAMEPVETLPDTIAERLEMPVLVDFRNTPLQEVVAYIGEEIKTEFVINGDGLKAAGFTQNMAQSHDMGTVTAKQALHAVLVQYAEERDPMVISVDEANKRITLTTQSQADLEGSPVFDLSP